MIVTEWDSFRDLDWPRIRSLMQRPLVLDGRNLLNGKEMVAMDSSIKAWAYRPQRPGVQMRPNPSSAAGAEASHLRKQAVSYGDS